jgi:hypothetical protein
MRRVFLAFTAAALVLLTSLPVLAADAQGPRYWVLHQEAVRPSKVQAYEQVTKELVGLIQQHREASPGFSFTAFSDPEFLYSYVSPVQDFAAIDAIYSGFGALTQAVGEARWNDVMKRAGEPITMIRESILAEDPSLSYAPAEPRLKPEEVRYLHFDLYYIEPGREPEADALARDFAALFRKKGLRDGYRLTKVIMGPDMPLYIVIVDAKDPADFEAQDAALRETLGAEGKALFARAFALSRRFERRGAWLRPDLSLPAARQASK